MFIKILLSFALLVSCNSPNKADSFMEGKQSESVLDFGEMNQKVKIEARVWGVAGNHEEISIFQINETDSDSVNVKQTFYTTELFYRKLGQDTLQIFASSSSYKEEVLHTIGNVILDINPIIGYDQVRAFNSKYKEMGLKRISVYD